MILEMLSDLGPWVWFILGLVLLLGEIFLPGVFLIWFGIAALIIGTLTLAPFTDVAWWPWQAQIVAFGVLSLIFVLVGRKIFPTERANDKASRINDPLGRYLGREAVLLDAIDNGVGRVKLGDTTWRVQGQDLPQGAKVRVVGAKDGILQVEPI